MSTIHELRGPEADGSFVIRFPNIRRGKAIKANTLSMDDVRSLVQLAGTGVELTEDVISTAWLQASKPCPLVDFSDVYAGIWDLAVRAYGSEQ